MSLSYNNMAQRRACIVNRRPLSRYHNGTLLAKGRWAGWQQASVVVVIVWPQFTWELGEFTW